MKKWVRARDGTDPWNSSYRGIVGSYEKMASGRERWNWRDMEHIDGFIVDNPSHSFEETTSGKGTNGIYEPCSEEVANIIISGIINRVDKWKILMDVHEKEKGEMEENSFAPPSITNSIMELEL